MIEIVQSDFKLKPYAHQLRGVKTLLQKQVYGLWWQMRLGKTKCILDTASILRKNGELDALVICCPAQVKPVWAHKEVGEVQKHCFVENQVIDFDSAMADLLDIWVAESAGLPVVVLSHELLRQDDAAGDYPRVHTAARALASSKKVWLVYDEASAFANHQSLQTKGAIHLRETLRPTRVTTMDGTPLGNGPIEQYSKFKVLDPSILGYKNFFHFRAVHGVMETSKFAKRGKAMVGFQRQDLIDKRVKGYCEYLAQEDCLDMPKLVKSYQVVRLDRKTWRTYCDMRDEMVAEIDTGEVSATNFAASKVLRLAQICQGFLGGVEDETTGLMVTREIGEEVLKNALQWLDRQLDELPDFKCVFWCRFRPEIERLHARIEKRYKGRVPVGLVYGSKRIYDEQLHPDSKHDIARPFILVAQPQAVRYGVNYSRADTQVFMSSDYNRVTRAQAEQRIQPGEGVRKISNTIEVLVEGPKGQKTVTWDISAVLANKEETERRTTQEWKKALLQE